MIPAGSCVRAFVGRGGGRTGSKPKRDEILQQIQADSGAVAITRSYRNLRDPDAGNLDHTLPAHALGREKGRQRRRVDASYGGLGPVLRFRSEGRATTAPPPAVRRCIGFPVIWEFEKRYGR